MTNTNNEIKIYSSNHAVYKTINIYPAIGDNVYVLHYGTTHLFNTDSKMEFIVSYQGTSNKILIINEDGTTIKEFTGANYAYPINVGGQGKLIVSFYSTGTSKVYSLPGTVAIKQPQNTSTNTLGQSYPNPATQAAIIPYKLAPGTSSTMYIYNANGALMEHLNIDSSFESIILNTSNYPAGIYYYSIGNESRKMIIIK